MTAREYLGQAYRLEQRIKMHRKVIEEMRELQGSVSKPYFGAHYSETRSTDAPFENMMIKIMELEKTETLLLEKLVSFKKEIVGVVNAVENVDEKIVLYQRYLCNRTWVEIAADMGCDEKTVRRWHNKALAHVKLPANPTKVI